MKKRLKINGILIAIAAALIFVFPGIFLQKFSATLCVWLMRLAGIFLILLGQFLRISARGFKSENSGNGTQLIQGGPYLLTRNPMYLGIFCIGLGMGLALFQFWAICVFVVIFVVRYVTLIFTEEKRLLERFGNTYAEYCKRVPRLFPSFNNMLRNGMRQGLPVKLSWVYKEIGSVVALFTAVLLFGAWGMLHK